MPSLSFQHSPLIISRSDFYGSISSVAPITVAARSKALTVFARSDAGIMGSNPAQGMDYVLCAFILCLCCSVCR
jgi:hypothetical protein